MAGARLFLGRGDDPDVVGKLARDGFQNLQARRVDAVVVGEQNAHYFAGSSSSRPPIQGRKAGGTVTEPSAFW